MKIESVFGALSDPTRLAIIERLLNEGELAAGPLAEPFNMSKPAVSRHLKVLEDAGLVTRRVDRQFRYFAANPQAFSKLDDWLSAHRGFWAEAFDRLDKLFDEEGEKI